jgi:hypothetical protein
MPCAKEPVEEPRATKVNMEPVAASVMDVMVVVAAEPAADAGVAPDGVEVEEPLENAIVEAVQWAAEGGREEQPDRETTKVEGRFDGVKGEAREGVGVVRLVVRRVDLPV